MKTIAMTEITATDWSDRVPKGFTGIIKWPDETKEWYQNGLLHREDGPARIYIIGTKIWFQNGKYCRFDGPAVEWPDGKKEYWIFDRELTKKEFQIFGFLRRNSTYEKTEELMKILVKLAKVK